MRFFAEVARVLFSVDQGFVIWRQNGIPDAVVRELAAFWKEAEREALGRELCLAPHNFTELAEALDALAERSRQTGGLVDWLRVADRVEDLSAREPQAGVIVALQAIAAWVGALADQLTFQPFEGYHHGWNVFPLVAARAMVAARAIWSARFVCEEASGFIEAAKTAPFDPTIRQVLADYREVAASAQRIYEDRVGELAWALTASSGPRPASDAGASFRPHLAALFWAAGDILHGELLSARGPADYSAPYPLVRDLVDHSMARLPRDPLMQYIWLEMKDRGPFNLREHAELFGHLNNRFQSHPLHALDEMLPFELGRIFARALIGWMGGRVEPSDGPSLLEAYGSVDQLVDGQAPDVSLRIRALLECLDGAGKSDRRGHWPQLAAMAASILAWADRAGKQAPFDRVLDPPLSSLPISSEEELQLALDAIEAYRRANLGYWLAITPPPAPQDPALSPALAEEQALLRELRGARFIRMLPFLPRHYRRYGFSFDDLEKGPPPGATAEPGASTPLGFDPFDQDLAERTLRTSWEHLQQLYLRMQSQAPAYAATRAAPPSSEAEFSAALRAHADR